MQSSLDEDMLLFLSVERVKTPARGRFGGGPGATGRIHLLETGDALPGKGEARIKAGETLVFETPGGGGFGDPTQRDPDLLHRDVEDGLISADAACTLYGKAR